MASSLILPQTGLTGFPDAADMIKAAMLLLDNRTILSMGASGRQLAASAGDSMMGYGSASGYGSFLAQLRMYLYDYDLIVDQRGQYNPDAATGASQQNLLDARYPANNRGYSFGAGGKNTQHMLDVQLPYIRMVYAEGKLPRIMFLSCFQNDGFEQVGSARASVDRVKQFITEVTAMGVTIIMMGMYPKNLVGRGTENAYGRHWAENEMRNWSNSIDRLIYVPFLNALKVNDAADEQNGLMTWKGTPGQIGATSNDGTHMVAYGARLCAELLEAPMRRLVRPYVPPTFDNLPFDLARNPYGNLLGPQGSLVGTGGTMNGSNNTGVPTGVQLLYDNTATTVTPHFETLNGKRYMVLDFSGTPTKTTPVITRFSVNRNLNPGQGMEIYGKARWVNAVGVSGIAVGQGEYGLPNGTVITPISNSIGGGGNLTDIMPFTMNGEVTLHSMMPAGFGLQYNQDIRFDLGTTLIAGVPVSGQLWIEKLGFFRSDFQFT